MIALEAFAVGSEKLFEAVVVGRVDDVGFELDKHGELVGVFGSKGAIEIAVHVGIIEVGSIFAHFARNGLIADCDGHARSIDGASVVTNEGIASCDEICCIGAELR